MELKAAIFDLDGTIIHNEDEYGFAFREILKRLGKEVNDKSPQVGSIGLKANWQYFIKKYNISTTKSLDELIALTQEVYLGRLSNVAIKEGFYEFCGQLRDVGILLGLATSNGWSVVEKEFEKFRLDNFFDAVTTEEEASFLKPAPDLFLITADKLGIDPAKSLVFEDAESGINAARSANMKVVGIAHDKNQAKELVKADLVVIGYSGLTLEMVAELFENEKNFKSDIS